MLRSITGFHTDEVGDWVAELACGHNQHVRNSPPLIIREWVTNEVGRAAMIGERLNCVKCDEAEPRDRD